MNKYFEKYIQTKPDIIEINTIIANYDGTINFYEKHYLMDYIVYMIVVNNMEI
jgi:hypothetical protein